MYGSTRRTNSALPSRSRLCTSGRKGQQLYPVPLPAVPVAGRCGSTRTGPLDPSGGTAAAAGIPDGAKSRRQAKLADHLDRQVGGAGQVVRRASRALPKLDQLGCAAAEPHGQGVGEIVLAVKMPLIQR